MTKRNQVSQSREQSNTIAEHIKHELARIQGCNEKLYQLCNAIDQSFNSLTNEIDDHLNKIVAQMPDYDKHDSSHSRRVLAIIERLLDADGIREMPFLEAEMLRFCCHFHDVGMAVPDWCFSLLRKVETEGFIWHKSREEIRNALRNNTDNWAPAKTFSEVRDLFLIPETELDFLDWLAELIWAYEDYRKGLLPWDGHSNRSNWEQETREDFFRSTHGIRAEQYSKGLWKKFPCLNKYHAIQHKISSDIGKICASHTQQFDSVENLPALEIVLPGIEDEALSYSPRFISMLLRLGDVLDFCEDRASLTLYAERSPMNHVSDKHWQVKNLTGLSMQIRTDSTRTKKISFMGCFSKPEHYYFIHDYLDWADDELKNYDRFLATIVPTNLLYDRYNIDLPPKVDRSGIVADEFTPDTDLKFTLEQQRTIELLMGAQLYENDFTCIRELYQNALDASRCMYAVNLSNGLDGDLPIVFGLETDIETGRKYLYCRDNGIGMTEEIVKKYLLRVGNSYYRSAEFRRCNSCWKNAVNPISEFGIGILSCFLIGDKIEIITRHFEYRVPLFICMDSSEGYGYYKEVTPRILDRIGEHGTEVRVYLKSEYNDSIYNDLPKDQDEAFDTISLIQYRHSWGDAELSSSGEEIVDQASNQLWCIIQELVCVPEIRFPIIVKNSSSEYVLQCIQRRYPAEHRISYLLKNLPMFSRRDIDEKKLTHKEEQFWIGLSEKYTFRECCYVDPITESEIRSWLPLPICPDADPQYKEMRNIYHAISRAYWGTAFCVDGIATIPEAEFSSTLSKSKFFLNFKGIGKPILAVSRERVHSYPDSSFETYERLLNGLYSETCQAISNHFIHYSYANTAANRSSILHHLQYYYISKPGFYETTYPQLYPLWNKLSFVFPFSSHDNCGLPMETLHATNSSVSIPIQRTLSEASCSINSPEVDIALSIAMKAKSIMLDKQNAIIEMKGCDYPDNAIHAHTNECPALVFYVQNWTNRFDFNCDIFPFISKDIRKWLEGEASSEGVASIVNIPSFGDMEPLLNPAAINRINGQPYITDVYSQLYLQGWANHNSSEENRRDGFWNDGTWIYLSEAAENINLLFYAFLSPKSFSKQDEIFLTSYRNNPSYNKGIMEGWSILYYPDVDEVQSRSYKAYGYIIAPGVIDRQELASHIPEDVRQQARENGKPFCFTDMTLAFPEETL